MADIINPFKNPYLPSFVNQQPRFEAPKAMPSFTNAFSQIHPVNGFNGAREYAAGLSNGSSEILSEADPEIARIYIVAKDQNGQVIMQPFGLVPVEEPKPITMDDLSKQMSELLERMNKLEEGRLNDESYFRNTGKTQQSILNARNQQNSGNGQNTTKPSSGIDADTTK